VGLFKHEKGGLCSSKCRAPPKCEHGRHKSQCKDCGTGFCQHGCLKSLCKDCGTGYCQLPARAPEELLQGQRHGLLAASTGATRASAGTTARATASTGAGRASAGPAARRTSASTGAGELLAGNAKQANGQMLTPFETHNRREFVCLRLFSTCNLHTRKPRHLDNLNSRKSQASNKSKPAVRGGARGGSAGLQAGARAKAGEWGRPESRDI
jgi:hypothetical protein